MLVARPATAQPTFANAISAGTVNVPGLAEASGVVASRNNAGVLWTHNDKGDSPRIFAIDTQGRWLGTYNLSGAAHVDYEDIALGPGPVTHVQYLFVADIGDNKSKRSSIQIYRIPEPAVYLRQATAPQTTDVKGLTTITLLYPDTPHDAETLFADPMSSDLFILTKDKRKAGIYRASKNQLDTGGPVVLSRMGQVGFNVATTAGTFHRLGVKSSSGRKITCGFGAGPPGKPSPAHSPARP